MDEQIGPVAIIRKEITIRAISSLDNMLRTSVFGLRFFNVGVVVDMFDRIKCEVSGVFKGIFT